LSCLGDTIKLLKINNLIHFWRLTCRQMATQNRVFCRPDTQSGLQAIDSTALFNHGTQVAFRHQSAITA
jgi:hypothetical protein